MNFLLIDDIDITSDQERALLLSSDEEIGSQLCINSIYAKSEKIFKYDEVNTRAYHREVRRILYAKMDVQEKLNGVHYHSFCRRFEREGELKSKTALPDYDAWCLVIGKARLAFNTEKFLKLYSNVRQQLKYLRNILNIRVSENF